MVMRIFIFAVLAVILLIYLLDIIKSRLLLHLAAARGSKWLRNAAFMVRQKRDRKNPYAEEMEKGITWLDRQEAEEVSVISFDGLRLAGHYLMAKDAHRTVLMMHGWRGTWKKDFGGIARALYEDGCNLLMVEQRAHGNSEGEYLGFGCLERHDCHTWITYLTNRFAWDCPLYLAGVSMGAAAVLMAAGDDFPDNVKGIIADSGFTTPYDMVCHFGKSQLHVREYPSVARVNRLCRMRAGYDLREYSTLEAMKNCKLPVFFTHSIDDDFVPHTFTLENHAACRAEKTLYLVTGVGHCMGFYKDKENYMAELKKFFKWNQQMSHTA